MRPKFVAILSVIILLVNIYFVSAADNEAVTTFGNESSAENFDQIASFEGDDLEDDDDDGLNHKDLLNLTMAETFGKVCKGSRNGRGRWYFDDVCGTSY